VVGAPVGGVPTGAFVGGGVYKHWQTPPTHVLVEL
jgi:hypothetical protein